MMRKVFLLLILMACYVGVFAQLTLKSEKGNFEARLIGRALFDGGVFFSDKTSLGNAMEVYDLRLGTVVRFLDRWTGKIEVGFAKSKVSMKDIFIEYRDGKNLFRVGHFFEPYSLEYRIGRYFRPCKAGRRLSGFDSGTLSLHSDQLSGHPGSGISGRKLTEVWISRRL